MKAFKLLAILCASGFAALALGLVAFLVTYSVLSKQLPEIDTSTDFSLEVPLRIYSADNKLIAEYGTQRRTPVEYEEIPEQLIQAFLSSEDDRFFEHPGVDWQGLVRAAGNLIATGSKGQGGSTITMQVARNFFLSPEKSYKRKLLEIFLALKIERELSKEEILSLYLNKIYLGKRAYGVAAAAQVYYGKELDELSLSQAAMIAGLPKAPSRYNPIANPRRALQRRNYVLRRMSQLNHIDDTMLKAAQAEDISAELQSIEPDIDAGYVAEMVRSKLVKEYGTEVYNSGFHVYTTIQSKSQNAANKALRAGLQNYDRRHGWRGAEQQVDIAALLAKATGEEENQDLAITEADAIQDYLSSKRTVGDLVPAVVTKVEAQSAIVEARSIGTVALTWDDINWAKAYIDNNKVGDAPETANQVLQVGDLVRLRVAEKTLDAETGAEITKWTLAQIPKAQGALVSLDPETGALLALTGGYDFYHSKFNRAVQSRRQPGSSFKPFLYSAALEKGYTAATIVNDAPVVFEDAKLETSWRPENYSGKFFGPTRLRWALTHSRNLVSIRILQDIGIRYTVDYAGAFGLNTYNMPRDLSLSLGSSVVSPYELAGAYNAFANGGFRMPAYFIKHIDDANGERVWQANPPVICLDDCQAQREKEAALVAEQEAEIIALAPEVEDNVEEALSADGATAETASEEKAAFTPPEPIDAERVMTPQNAWLMNSMLGDVVRFGTARKALSLKRKDIAGKTGTTNDQKDAWFAGYTPKRVTVAWVGFDEVDTLGRAEVGGRAALPIWIEYMREELQGVPEVIPDLPDNLINVRIDKTTGERAQAGASNAMFETFRTQYAPKDERQSNSSSNFGGGNEGGDDIIEELF
ncbi:MAG: penicillin-binding protein 1A [Gammaproteobacteria bacterium]|nr:penicillin-binding protein 1A [Gammaproteobacteria bacterium]